MKKVTVEELLAKAQQPSLDAPRLHKFYKGKMGTALKCRIRDFNDFAIWYTPGVAAPCRAIQENPDLAYEYSSKSNTVAIVTDSTRVQGLQVGFAEKEIRAVAGLPLMEGKALLFKYLGGVDAIPICLGTQDPDEMVRATKWLQPSFGGVNLEDISQPKCFRVLDTLRRECRIPVWHDDQQGTAAVTVAGRSLVDVVRMPARDVLTWVTATEPATPAVTLLPSPLPGPGPPGASASPC